MNIQPIPYGLNRNATTLQLDWGIKHFFDDVLKLNISLFDEGNNIIETLTKEMTMAEYLAYGSTKEERAGAILVELGYVVLMPEKILNNLKWETS
jgi:hypothetical protein